MTPDREDRLADLLLAAFERPEEEWRPFLEAECGDDRELLEEIFECLLREKALGDFLEVAPELAPRADDDPAELDTTVLVGAGPPPPSEATESWWPGAEDRVAGPDETTLQDGDPEPQPPRLGRRLGGYRILEHLGAGGMGQVYVAEDPRLGRRIALKRLPEEMAGQPQWLERFEREAKALGSLNHPNIVTIHSIEEDGGIHFLTMELIDGRTLKEATPEHGMDLEGFLGIALDLTDALVAAHDRGVIHRDLKPANVMLTRDGRAKILDFGIAKMEVAGQHSLSHEGVLIGTVAYMAPEQLRGDKATHRSDLFSLGVLLFQLATGRHPFPASTPLQRMGTILKSEPPPLESLRPDLPGTLGEILAQCLAKAPEDRFESARDLHGSLSEVQETLRTEKILESRTDLQLELATPPPVRKPWSLVAMLVAGVLLASSVTFVTLRRVPTPTPPTISVAPEETRSKVAVLPFKNLGGHSDLDWLSIGLAELLMTDLAQAPSVSIVGGSALLAKVEGLDTEHDRQGDLEVDPDSVLAVLSEGQDFEIAIRGSFARLGEVLRLDFSVDDLGSGEILRSGSLEGTGEASLFGLVDQASSAILEALGKARPELGPTTVQEATTSSLDAWQAYARAQDLYLREGRVDEALAQLEEAQRIDPEFALAWVAAAKMHQSQGRTAEAVEATRQAFERVDQLPLRNRFEVELGYYATRWSTLGKAIETYGLALKVYPGPAGIHNNLARRLAFFERYDDALEEFDRAIATGEGFWGDVSGSATALAALGDFESGALRLSQHAEAHPEDWRIHYALAWHLTEWGRYDDAATRFERAATLAPDSPMLPYGRWRLETLRGDREGAEAEIDRLLAFDDPFARWRAHVSRARMEISKGRSESALDQLNRAIEASTGADRALARCFKSELLLARDEPELARDEALQAQAEGRDQWPELMALFLAARAEQALGNPDLADQIIETLRERWRRQPNAVEERQLLRLEGLLDLARGRTDEALAGLERAARLLPPRGVEFSWHVFPDHVPLWTDVATAALAADRPELALEWLERIEASGAERLEQPLGTVASWFLSGRAHQRLGNSEAAVASFDRFLKAWGEGDLAPSWRTEAAEALAQHAPETGDSASNPRGSAPTTP